MQSRHSYKRREGEGGDGRGGGGKRSSFFREDVDLLGHVNIKFDLIMLQWRSNADSTVESAAVGLETGGLDGSYASASQVCIDKVVESLVELFLVFLSYYIKEP